jgi:hypothetical protein
MTTSMTSTCTCTTVEEAITACEIAQESWLESEPGCGDEAWEAYVAAREAMNVELRVFYERYRHGNGADPEIDTRHLTAVRTALY